MNKPINQKLESLRAELELNLDEGHSLRVGTIRMWKSGKYQKTSTGWVPVDASVKSIAARAAHTSAPQDIMAAAMGKVTTSTREFINTKGIVTLMPGGSKTATATPTAKLTKGSMPSYTHQIKGKGKPYATPLAGGAQSKPPSDKPGGIMLYKKGDAPGAKATPVAMGQSKPPPKPTGALSAGHHEAYRGFDRLAGLTDDRIFEMKKVADMGDDEVVAHAKALVAQAVFSRHGARKMASPDQKRFKEAMQRIKDEGLMDDDDQDKLAKKWKGA